jgi:hypothetical protein
VAVQVRTAGLPIHVSFRRTRVVMKNSNCVSSLISADDVSYQYCCAGRQVITMYVMVFEKPDVSCNHG